MLSTFVAIAILLLLSAVSAAAETAIFLVDRIRLRTLAEKKHTGATIVEKLRTNPKRLLGTLLLFNNVVNVALSAVITVFAINAFGNAWIGLATGFAAILLVVFGEYIPKSYATHHAERIAFLAAAPVYALTLALGPIVVVIERAAGLFIKSGDHLHVPRVSEEEIRTMAKIGARAGTLEHGEREMIERVFLFNDITAADVMTPREDVEFLDGRKPLSDALPTIMKTRYSRFPVHSGDDDRVAGVVHIKNVFEAMTELQAKGGEMPKIAEVALTPMFVPETKLIDDLFRDFQRQRAHMAIVINEYGTMVGLVTVDDLLAELVGEIADESDIDEHIIKRIDKMTVVVHGDAGIRAINRFLNARIPGPSNKTISRVILEETGDIPEAGRVVKIAGGLTATIEQIANLRIARVRLVKQADRL